MIAKARALNRMVVTATQMLESMIEDAEPTRAEASDVANAILDGTSAIMLSGETAVGNHPVAAVEVMDRIARAVEPSLAYGAPGPRGDVETAAILTRAACDTAEELDAAAIAVPTETGATARHVSACRTSSSPTSTSSSRSPGARARSWTASSSVRGRAATPGSAWAS
jgi:pyruvate kinase